jgi:cation:H+ antiporter
MLLEIAALIIGIALLAYSSERTVDHSVRLAKAFKIPPLIIGVILISLGTDIPEISNSIISSFLGHGDINVGNAFGSPLAQITIVLGIAILFGGSLKIKRSEIAHLGIAALAATLLALLLVSDGNVTRADAAALIFSYVVFLLYICKCIPQEIGITRIKESAARGKEQFRTFLMIAVSIVGVIAGSGLVVNSVISLSSELGVSEFIISFFLIGLGTSLPELAVTLSAIRKREFGLAIGDAFGSNITDLTLALGIGPLFFPNILTAGLVSAGTLYLFAATAIVVALLWWRRRIGRIGGLILILLYLASYLIIPML